MTVKPIPPNMARSGYGNRADAEAASFPTLVDHLLLNGMALERMPAGLAQEALMDAAGQQWTPAPHSINVNAFRKVSDADDTDALRRCFDHVAELKAREGYIDNIDGEPTYHPMVISGAGLELKVSSQIEIEKEMANTLFRDFHITAIGEAGTDWEDEGGTDIGTDDPATWAEYRPHASDHVFRAKANANYLVFENLNIHCRNLCGGLRLRNRSRVINSRMWHVAGHAVHASNNAVWIIGCGFRQWGQGDAEYYDKTKYTAQLVLSDESDMRLALTELSWAAELVRIDGTNNNLWNNHLYNGMRGYLGSWERPDGVNETRTATKNAALTTYFGTTIDDTVDVPARDWNPILVATGGSATDNTWADNYYDNGHVVLFGSNGWHFRGLESGRKTNSSILTAPDRAFITAYPSNNGEIPQLYIKDAHPFVESRIDRMVEFLDHPVTGDSWGVNLSAFHKSGFNMTGSDWGDGFSFKSSTVTVLNNGDLNIKPLAYYSVDNGMVFGFADKSTTLGTLFGGVDLAEWQTGVGVGKFSKRRHGTNVYQSHSNDDTVTGTTPPTHQAGMENDDGGGNGVDWKFIGTTDPDFVTMGIFKDNGRIRMKHGPLVIGGNGDPVVKSGHVNGLTIRTGTMGTERAAPTDSDNITLEMANNGGMNVNSPDGTVFRINMTTNSQDNAFTIEFNDATKTARILIDGVEKASWT